MLVNQILATRTKKVIAEESTFSTDEPGSPPDRR
jgi:hypothetical protein